ncbi:MAG: hypothetical protein JWR50_2231 [Mucilaginibacter sp.]|nr:hypothetical protein [Mucilaginibacter sp.]
MLFYFSGRFLQKLQKQLIVCCGIALQNNIWQTRKKFIFKFILLSI